MIQFDKKILPYISGEKFSNALTVEIKELFPDNKRVDLIKNLCVNKKIIHIGCVDHLPLIEEKINKNHWLHKLITEVSSETIGIDINKEGIEYLQNKLNIKNVLYANIVTDDIPEIKNKKWDYMILGEIVEHVDNPVHFLNSIREKYQDVVDKIIITVPHILVKNRTTLMYKNSMELINTDHRYWFTPFTLTKVMYQAGFRDINLDFAERVALTQLELIKRKLKRLANKKPFYPFYYFNSIVGIAKFK
jgi:hypothetical protein